MTWCGVHRAFVSAFAAGGAAGWLYTGVVAGGSAAIACVICAGLSAALPWVWLDNTKEHENGQENQ